MITKMTKYSFVVLSGETPGFLAKLQELGMMDINREEKPVDNYSRELADKLTRITQLSSKLKEAAKEKEITVTGTEYNDSAEAFLDETAKLFARIDVLRNEVDVLRDFIRTATPWGDFSKEDLDKIVRLGFTLHAYVTPVKRMNPEWEKEYPLFELNRTEGNIYFVVLEIPGTPYSFPLNETQFPSLPYTTLIKNCTQKENELKACRERLSFLAVHRDILKVYATEVSSELDLYMASVSGDKQVEGYIDLLTGFIPTEHTQELEKFLEKESLYYVSSPADIEDNPPVKLKNNWFTRLFEPIGNMYMLPVYSELDLTPYFAPFYMLFFGLCLGDMGYGLLLMVTGLAGKFFLPKMRGYLNLAFFLGLGSFLMASLSGSFFGMKVIDLFPAVGNVQDFFFLFSDMKMFWFAILFGLFQIIFARILTGIDSMIRKGWQHGMAPFGWAILIIWCTLAYASTMVPGLKLPKEISTVMLIVSVSLIILFSKPEGPIYKRFGKGLWAMYDITGVFGDMLSYIRLFGLGTSGGILGMVINTLAISLSGVPYIGWLLTVVLLLIGHALVLGLSALGAFVHPMRLTFVEFYKNAGFTGGGRAYKPLKIK